MTICWLICGPALVFEKAEYEFDEQMRADHVKSIDEMLPASEIKKRDDAEQKRVVAYVRKKEAEQKAKI